MLLLTLGTVCLLQVGCGGSGPPRSGAQAVAVMLLWKLPGWLHLAPEPAVSQSVPGKPLGLSPKLCSHLSHQSLKMLRQQLWSLTHRVKVSNALRGCLCPSSASLYRQEDSCQAHSLLRTGKVVIS